MIRFRNLILTLCFVVFGATLHAEKIGDLTNIAGVRDNQLMGYGIVIGLNGTGDKGGSKFTAQSMANMLEAMKRSGAIAGSLCLSYDYKL